MQDCLVAQTQPAARPARAICHTGTRYVTLCTEQQHSTVLATPPQLMVTYVALNNRNSTVKLPLMVVHAIADIGGDNDFEEQDSSWRV